MIYSRYQELKRQQKIDRHYVAVKNSLIFIVSCLFIYSFLNYAI